MVDETRNFLWKNTWRRESDDYLPLSILDLELERRINTVTECKKSLNSQSKHMVIITVPDDDDADYGGELVTLGFKVNMKPCGPIKCFYSDLVI